MKQPGERESDWVEIVDKILNDWVFPIGLVLIVIWAIRWVSGQ